jgi:uncharacterized membrane protein YgcG
VWTVDSTVVLLVILLVVVVVGALVWNASKKGAVRREQELADSAAEARRWVERLGGQVYSLEPGNDSAARQALADAGERFTAAGSQVDQAKTAQQYLLAQQTAYEGLYYVRAARTSLGLDPGPDIPPMPGQAQAGTVTEDRRVEVEGRDFEASPAPSDRTSHYYPGGMVAGKPVPQGWYSEPWWRPALVAGAWGVGTYLIASSLFAGMAGTNAAYAYDSGYDQGLADGSGDQGGDAGGDQGYDGGGDAGYDSGGGWDGGGGGDWGGGGSDFGGGGFDGGF